MTESSGKKLPPNVFGPAAFLSKDALDLDNPEPWCGGSLLLSNLQKLEQVRNLMEAIKTNQINLFFADQTTKSNQDQEMVGFPESETAVGANAMLPAPAPQEDDHLPDTLASLEGPSAVPIEQEPLVPAPERTRSEAKAVAVLSWWFQKMDRTKTWLGMVKRGVAALLAAVRRPGRAGWVSGLLAGAAIGAMVTFLIYHQFNGFRAELERLQTTSGQAQTQLKQRVIKLEKDLEARDLDLNNLSLGYNQLSKLLTRSSEPPSKPRYKTVGSKLFIYWVDDVLWRRYYVYRRGPNSQRPVRQSARAQKENFIFVDQLPPGIWSFAVSALDREGKETAMSAPVTMVIK